VLVLVAAHARAVFDNGPADSVSGWFGQVQLAALASMSPRGVRGAVDRGELPAFSGYVVRIDRARAWLAARKVPGFPPVATEVPA
jgi:hypothetical protein